MSWMVGYLNQETIGVPSLLLGGVFDTIPSLNVLVTHGGATPFQFGRFEQARQRGVLETTVAKQRTQKPLDTYLSSSISPAPTTSPPERVG